MENPVTDGFKGLLRFHGRDRRGRFWPYAAVVVALYMVLGQAISAAVMAPIFTAVATATPGRFPSEMGRTFGRVLLVNGAEFAVVAALLAAAVVRRLHDRGLSGLWALMPVPFVAYSGYAFWRMFSSFFGPAREFGSGVFMSAFASNMLYLVTLVILIVLLALPSGPANRHDEPNASAL